MARGFSLKLIPAVMLVAFSGAASASGFQLLEQNASGIGNAFAGSAASAENASTIYFNPAGMTQLQAHEFSVGVAAVDPSYKFKNTGSQVGALAGTGNGGDAGGWAYIPNAYGSWAITKDLYVGLGVGAPFGLKTEYDDRWVGAAQSTAFEIETINVNPSIAYRVNDKVSLGFGVDWQKADATYKRVAAVNNAVTANSPVKLTLDDDAWGWNAGALFTLSPSTKVGLSYRSAIEYTLTGKIDVSSSSAAVVNGGSSKAKADIKLPDTAIMSVTQQISDKWQMLGDISWTGWSSVDKVDIVRTTQTPLFVPGVVGQPAGATAQTLNTDFRDTWRVALGGTYKYNDAWKLKFGLAYDQTPVKGPTTRLTSLPDSDRIWYSFGGQWAPAKGSLVDFGATYIYAKDSKIYNDQAAAGRGLIVGEYNNSSIWILGGQYSMSF
jgi:long-chain fatty acid transport protein